MVTYLTAAGNRLMGQVLGDESVLNFTKIQFGSGTGWTTENEQTLRNEIWAATALKNDIKEIYFDNEDEDDDGVATVTPENNLAKLEASFENIGDSAGWHVTEIGIFAQDGDITNKYVKTADETIVNNKTYSTFASTEPAQASDLATCYEKVGSKYVLTADTSIDGEKTYYAKTDVDSPSAASLSSYYEPASEILYAVSAVDLSKAAWIPPYDESVATFAYDVYVYVGDVADVTAVLSLNAEKATQSALDDHIYNYNNPHKVSKETVELGNVPNVKTNDQRPYYTQAEQLINIDGSSQWNQQIEDYEGVETLSTIFGKIKKAIAEFILHKDNTNNPHKVTAAQVGAAAVQHYHNGQDINSGMVKPEHGGTAAVYDKSTALSNSSDCAVVLWTEESGNGLYKCGGYVNCDSRKVWVAFPKEFNDTRYTVTFDTSGGGGLIPMWKKPEKYTNGFYMVRTLGIDSTPLKDALKRVFFFSDSIKEAIDDGIGASHAADWTVIGQIR